MPRIPREDTPGSWHHVYNRAIARRTLFERREDYRYFLSQLARASRRGEIELHAYCLMGTHYHLLVRSLGGNLSSAMQRVQLAYSRRFNRSRRRDGGLVRARYGSRPVRTLAYRRVLLRYIDINPCKARLCASPELYPWGSAAHYARATGPRWLKRGWVESEIDSRNDRRARTSDGLDPERAAREAAEVCSLVDARLSRRTSVDPLDDIVSAASAATRRWMVRKAMLADGTKPGLPILSIAQLQRVIERKRVGEWLVRDGNCERSGWDLALVGLGRDLCGQTLRQLARLLVASETKTHRIYAMHRSQLRADTAYASAVVHIAEEEVVRGVQV